MIGMDEVINFDEKKATVYIKNPGGNGLTGVLTKINAFDEDGFIRINFISVFVNLEGNTSKGLYDFMKDVEYIENEYDVSISFRNCAFW